MRPQQNRRIRGRGNNNNGNNRRGPNPLTRNYESNGPDVKIRGNAQHIADKYAALARDVQAAGDRVMAENYLQHAEHYMRIILSAQPQFAQPLRVEAQDEESEASDNIVELPLTESDAGQENLLHLVVNREAEESSTTATLEEPEGVGNLPPSSQEAKPKAERVRRMTRRRLPRQIQSDEVAALGGESGGHENSGTEASFLPAFITESQDKTNDAPPPVPQQELAATEARKPVRRTTKTREEGEEKPPRKRRSVKNADTAASA